MRRRTVEIIILPLDENETETISTEPRPQFGNARGQVSISDDFDQPLEDFAEYMPQ